MTQTQPPVDGHRLPPAPRLTNLGIFGATAIFTALAIGSGELMFWPQMVVTSGASAIWIALFVVALQWFVNIEVARYSLATGRTVGVGIARHSPVIAFLLFLGALVPWIWPGWIRAGGQMLSAIGGWNEKWLSLGILVVCAAILLVPRRAYMFLERVQSWMLAALLIGIAWLFGVVAFSTGGFPEFIGQFLVADGARGAIRSFTGQSDSAYFALLSGVVFAGAGGILNLGYGYLVLARNRTHSMIKPVDPGETAANWRRWIRVLRTEHGLLFLGGNTASIFFLSALFFMIYRDTGTELNGINLLSHTFQRIAGQYGQINAVVFAAVGFLVFFTSSIGILDLTCRIASDIFLAIFNVGIVVEKHIFAGLVVLQSAVSAVLIFVDPRQPFWLISTAAVLNTLVMALYAFVIVWLNRKELTRSARPSLPVELVVLFLGVLYAIVFAMTVFRLLG